MSAFEPPSWSPGSLVEGLPEPVYRAAEGANFSTLRHYGRSAAHGLWHSLHPKEPTPSMRLGSLLDGMLFQPGELHRWAVRGPECKNRTVKAWKDFAEEASSAGLEPYHPDEWRAAEAMARNLRAHPEAGRFLAAAGKPQVCAFWTDPATGLRCKARLDWLIDSPRGLRICDLKSAHDAREDGFGRAIADHQYHVQAAHYVAGAEAAAGRPLAAWHWLVVENEPPHLANVHEIHPDDLARGEAKRGRLLATFAECRAAGRWPGYPNGIKRPRLPAWADSEA